MVQKGGSNSLLNHFSLLAQPEKSTGKYFFGNYMYIHVYLHCETGTSPTKQ